MSAALIPHGPVDAARSAQAVVAALGLPATWRAGNGGPERAPGTPVVVAAMILAADGRAAVEGSSAALGHPADSALLRELRCAVDAILVGTGTLRAERYANLLDDDQRERRAARGLAREPIVATISRRGHVPLDVPLLAEPEARVQVYTEAEPPPFETPGATIVVTRRPDGATPPAVLDALAEAHGVRSVLCEGGPTLLRALVEAGCVDHLLLTLSPLLVAGSGRTVLEGAPLDPPARLALRDVHRAGDHLFMHYAAAS